MDIYQTKKGYRYNSDTLMLYDFISKNKIHGNVLEVGCGCGVLGLLLKRDFKDINLTMIDIQKINSDLAIKNSLKNDIECDVLNVDFRDFRSEKKFDFIISNPPFYKNDTKKSDDLHLKISRYSENLELKELIASANKNLTPKGVLEFCYDARFIMDVFYELKVAKFNVCKIKFIYGNLSKSSNLVLIYAKKSSKSMCEIEPPIFVNSSKIEFEKFLDEAKEIYNKANLKSYDL